MWKNGNTTKHIAARHKVEFLHSLQSCKPGARVLDEHSAYTTASRVWGWVSGCPAPRGVLPSIPHTAEARRPSWHVEPTPRARFWRFTSYLNRAIIVLPVWCRRMTGSCRADIGPLPP